MHQILGSRVKVTVRSNMHQNALFGLVVVSCWQRHELLPPYSYLLPLSEIEFDKKLCSWKWVQPSRWTLPQFLVIRVSIYFFLFAHCDVAFFASTSHILQACDSTMDDHRKFKLVTHYVIFWVYSTFIRCVFLILNVPIKCWFLHASIININR